MFEALLASGMMVLFAVVLGSATNWQIRKISEREVFWRRR